MPNSEIPREVQNAIGNAEVGEDDDIYSRADRCLD